jgi:hypothetical protein
MQRHGDGSLYSQSSLGRRRGMKIKNFETLELPEIGAAYNFVWRVTGNPFKGHGATEWETDHLFNRPYQRR